jgi:hypothetical protein
MNNAGETQAGIQGIHSRIGKSGEYIGDST